MKKNILPTLIKLIVSSILLIWLCSTLNLDKLQSYFHLNSFITLLLISMFIAISSFAVGYRWKILIHTMGENISVINATKNVIIGTFFNQFLPSSFGGDFFRVFMIKKYNISISVATYSIIIDRLYGFLGLIIICIVSTPFVYIYTKSINLILVQIFIIISFLIIIVSIFLIEYLPENIKRKKNIMFLINFFVKLKSPLKNKSFKNKILSISTLLHIINIIFLYLMTLACDIQVSFLVWLVIMPPIILISSLPISIAGWGLREGIMIIALNEIGINKTDAFMLSLSYGLAIMIAGLLGGIFWVMEHTE